MSNKFLKHPLLAFANQAPTLPMPADYLHPKFFPLTLLAALILHLIGLYAWHLMPKMQVVDIPVHVLNIKLGEGDITPEEIKAMQPQADNKIAVESSISHLVRENDQQAQARKQTVASAMDKAMKDKAPVIPKAPAVAPKAPPVPVKPVIHEKLGVKGKFDVRSEGVAAAAPVMPVVADNAAPKQFVRENMVSVKSSDGVTRVSQIGGNSTAANAEMISRYEQMISLWIEKFKIYPSEARAQGMEGETVVRIRIDRQGNIRYYILEHSTGFETLDRAATDMIRRANPVPAVPTDYPPGDLIEFLIPVNFHLQ